MARRKRARRARPNTPTETYAGPEESVLVLRRALSVGTIAKIRERPVSRAATLEDAWHRRFEMLFERLAVSWEIAGLPITDQKMLLGRLRMADPATQAWVRETIGLHVERHIPELAGDER